MMRLAHPWALLVLAVLPLLWFLWLRRERRAVIRFSGLSELAAAGGSFRPRLRLILPALRTVALVALIVAAARPQRADESSRVYVEGIAIEAVIDTSSSMSDLDLSPRGERWTRLDVVKDVLTRFIDGGGTLPGRPNDLIGLVRFARFADSTCPLTLDHAAVREVLKATNIVTPQGPEDRTAIGDGLALAVERLRDLKRTTGSGEQLVIKSRIVILLTDGENNAGMIAPEQAGELAATYGIRVYTILGGTGQRVGFTRLPVDDTALRHIADVSGGKFYRATDADTLTRVYAEIDQLERTRAEERRYTEFSELSRPFLLVAFAAVALQTLLDATRLRKAPG